FTERQFKDRYSLLFFGFTNCPDICPDTLNQIAEAKDRLELMRVEPHKLPQVVFVSVDPERDQGQAMMEYVRWFDEDFIAITGSDDALLELTGQVGALYLRLPADDSGFYTVDHSGMIVIIDPEARMMGRFPQPIDTEDMVADLFELSRRG
ncbi:MAG: SCO family protein, partial [Pseudomonadota bacterium]